MPKFELQGLVERIRGANGEISSVLASGGIVKSAANGGLLKAQWQRDMMAVFGDIGPDYNIEFHCTVTPVPNDTPLGPVPAKLKLARFEPLPEPVPMPMRRRGFFRRILDAMFAEGEM